MSELIQKIEGKSPTGQPRVVRVEWSEKWAEFQCKVVEGAQRQPNLDHFTKDRDDALAKAYALCGMTFIRPEPPPAPSGGS